VTGAGIRGQVVSMSVSTENTIPPVFLKVNFVVSSFSATLFQNDKVSRNNVSKKGSK